MPPYSTTLSTPLFPPLNREHLTEAQLDTLRDYRAQVEGVLQRFATERSLVEANGDLSALGKQRRMGDAGRLAVEKLQQIKAQLDGVEKRLAEEEGHLRASMSSVPKDSAVAEMRAAEIRRNLIDRTNLDAGALLLEAAETADDELYYSIVGAPKLLLRSLGIPAETIALAQATFAEKRAPTTAALIRSLRAFRAQVEADVGFAIGQLVAAGAIPSDDPIRRFAVDGLGDDAGDDAAARRLREEIERTLG